MGERMEIRTPEAFSWSYLSLQEAGGPRAASMDGEDGAPAWLRVPNNKVNTASGTHHWGWGGERALRKNIHLEFFLFCLSTLCH